MNSYREYFLDPGNSFWGPNPKDSATYEFLYKVWVCEVAERRRRLTRDSGAQECYLSLLPPLKPQSICITVVSLWFMIVKRLSWGPEIVSGRRIPRTRWHQAGLDHNIEKLRLVSFHRLPTTSVAARPRQACAEYFKARLVECFDANQPERFENLVRYLDEDRASPKKSSPKMAFSRRTL